VNGGTIAINYGDSIKVNWGNTPGEFTLRAQEFSRHGCPAVPVTGRVVVSAPLINLGDDIEICQGETAFIAPEGNFASYRWHDGSTSPTFLARNQGVISLEVTDQYGCRRSENLMLTVHPLPRVDLGRDTALCGIESLFLDAGSDGARFRWSTGEITREIIAYQGSQTIWVNVKDAYNCENSDTIKILTCSTIDYFKDMPTAFTPNDDGVNDEWRIPELQSFPQAVVEIFDRWGNMIFRSEPGYSRPWDGTYQGRDMPMDSYYFIIRLNSGGMEPLTGTVTLIR
jgi:gliding motility-associated-like protein